jgi:hypothetical protein
MIAFHAEQVEFLRTCIREHREFCMVSDSDRGVKIDEMWFKEHEERIATLKWEDGSVSAVWRDRLAFHEASLEYLTHAYRPSGVIVLPSTKRHWSI